MTDPSLTTLAALRAEPELRRRQDRLKLLGAGSAFPLRPGPFTPACFWNSSIHVSRKGWHMLLNLCFHMAMTSAGFAGGITLTNYRVVCQVVSRKKRGPRQFRGSARQGPAFGST